MPVEPESIENREIFDIRITTAARGSGEKAIRRLKFKFNRNFNLGLGPNKKGIFDFSKHRRVI